MLADSYKTPQEDSQPAWRGEVGERLQDPHRDLVAPFPGVIENTPEELQGQRQELLTCKHSEKPSDTSLPKCPSFPGVELQLHRKKMAEALCKGIVTATTQESASLPQVFNAVATLWALTR